MNSYTCTQKHFFLIYIKKRQFYLQQKMDLKVIKFLNRRNKVGLFVCVYLMKMKTKTNLMSLYKKIKTLEVLYVCPNIFLTFTSVSTLQHALITFPKKNLDTFFFSFWRPF